MKYDSLASNDSVQKTMTALTELGYLPEFVASRSEALSRIKDLVPANASVMNGGSRTLEEIGFVQYLKDGKHGWNNLHETILAEKDPAKQGVLRKQSVLSDFYLGSAHAVSENGDIVIASYSGSQLPHIAFTSQNIVLVVGTQKITPTLNTALTRLDEYVLPLESARMKEIGMGGSFISKLLILKKEQPFMGRKFHIILVGEKLGF
jgi:hypothetical protein